MPRKSAKKAGNTRFLTELGIDRLYPEPKSNFLPFGSPKSPKSKYKIEENVKIPDFWGKGGGSGGLGPIFPFYRRHP